MKLWAKATIVLFGLFYWAMIFHGTNEVLEGLTGTPVGYGEYDADYVSVLAVLIGTIGPPIWIIYLQEWIKEWRMERDREERLKLEQYRAYWSERARRGEDSEE